MSSGFCVWARGAASDTRQATTMEMDLFIYIFLPPRRFPAGDPFHDPVGRVLRGPPPGALSHSLEVRLLVAGLDVQADDRVAHPRDGLPAESAARLVALLAAEDFDEQVGIGTRVDEGDDLSAGQRLAHVADGIEPSRVVLRLYAANGRCGIDERAHRRLLVHRLETRRCDHRQQYRQQHDAPRLHKRGIDNPPSTWITVPVAHGASPRSSAATTRPASSGGAPRRAGNGSSPVRLSWAFSA